jgi:hypothetical protein
MTMGEGVPAGRVSLCRNIFRPRSVFIIDVVPLGGGTGSSMSYRLVVVR